MDYSQLKVFVAGHNILVGSALCRAMARRGCRNIITRTRAELDLLNSAAVDEFVRSLRPEAVYLAAAKVGGIYANNTGMWSGIRAGSYSTRPSRTARPRNSSMSRICTSSGGGIQHHCVKGWQGHTRTFLRIRP